MSRDLKSNHKSPTKNESRRDWQKSLTSNASCPAHHAIHPGDQADGSDLVRALFPKAGILPAKARPSIIKMSNRRLLSINNGKMAISEDRGRTWTRPKAIDKGSGPGKVQEGVAVRTGDGVIVLVYLDLENLKFPGGDTSSKSQDVKEQFGKGRLDVWTIRSLDEGQTWVDKQMIFKGFCGAVIDMIVSRTGRLIVPVQRLVEDPIRNITCTYFSDDQGKTWQRSNMIDLGGHGKHDGAFEATLEELRNGRLLMLIRTPWDRFWEAYSDDVGKNWRELRASCLDSSNSPGYLTRLASGRLLFVWNWLFPEGEYSYPRPRVDGNLLSEFASSWQREELSVAFSEDEGGSWSKPLVILKGRPGSWFSYPYAVEPEPGVVWIFTCHKEKIGISVKEIDLVTFQAEKENQNQTLSKKDPKI